MAIFKMSCFILCYFFARAAFSCETYDRGTTKESICFDEKTQSQFSEKCLKSDCDAKKFLSQHKASKSKTITPSGTLIGSAVCAELQLPVVILKDSKNKDVPFCLFNDGSVLDAATVERLVL